MDDNDPKFEPEQEEYHFTETEPTESDVFSTTTPTEPSKPKVSRINRKMIFIIIIVIVIALSLYKLIGVFLTPSVDKTTTAPTTVPTTQQVTTTPIPTQPLTQPIYNDQLATLQTGASQNTAQITALQSQVNSLASSISSLQSSVATMNDQLQTIASNLQQQQAQIISLQPKVKPVYIPTPPTVVKKPIVRIKYYIQAIIPGRAWLLRPDGTTITVAIGDKLTGYGSITNIDPTRGLVMTSSGVVLRYKGS